MGITREETTLATLRGCYFAQEGTYRYAIDAIASLKSFDLSTLASHVRSMIDKAERNFRLQESAPKPPHINVYSLQTILEELCRDNHVRSVTSGNAYRYEATLRFLEYHKAISSAYDQTGWKR